MMFLMTSWIFISCLSGSFLLIIYSLGLRVVWCINAYNLRWVGESLVLFKRLIDAAFFLFHSNHVHSCWTL